MSTDLQKSHENPRSNAPRKLTDRLVRFREYIYFVAVINAAGPKSKTSRNSGTESRNDTGSTRQRESDVSMTFVQRNSSGTSVTIVTAHLTATARACVSSPRLNPAVVRGRAGWLLWSSDRPDRKRETHVVLSITQFTDDTNDGFVYNIYHECDFFELTSNHR